MSIDKVIKNAAASVEMEGYQVDSECVKWCKKLLDKEMDFQEYIALVKQKAEATAL